jgi:hypothetical protein
VTLPEGLSPIGVEVWVRVVGGWRILTISNLGPQKVVQAY